MKPEKAKKYLEQRGLACPFCGCWDIEGGSMDFEDDEIAQRISCHKCNQRWTDVYKLVALADPDSGVTIASISIQAEKENDLSLLFLYSPRDLFQPIVVPTS